MATTVNGKTYALRNYQTNQILDVDSEISPELGAASLAEPTGTGAVRASCEVQLRQVGPRSANNSFPGRQVQVWVPGGDSTVYVEQIA